MYLLTLHSISLFCTGEIALFTDLGLIDVFSADHTAEIVACVLDAKTNPSCSLSRYTSKRIPEARFFSELRKLCDRNPLPSSGQPVSDRILPRQILY